MSIARSHLAARIALALMLPAAAALASGHLVQIHQVVGGVNGDTEIQAIQLRTRAAGQNQFQNSKLLAYDADGENPVLIIDFDRALPNGNLGDTVLVASTRFGEVTTPQARPDFVMTNLVPASYLPAGSLTLEDDAGKNVWWRLSWGGDDYHGDTTGSTANDPDGEFGPPARWPFIAVSTKALGFFGSAKAMSTTNAADYRSTERAAVFVNNSGESFAISVCVGVVCGDMNCDSQFNSADIDPFFEALGDPAAWQAAHPNCPLPCVGDINEDGHFDGADIGAFFAATGGHGPCRE